MDGENDHAVGVVVLVDDEHPAPGPEKKPQARPSARQLAAPPGKLCHGCQAAPEAGSGLTREAVGGDQRVEVLDGCGKLDARDAGSGSASMALDSSERARVRSLTWARSARRAS